MPASVPGGPESLPQLPEMPESSFGKSHSPHLPQPQVGRQDQGRVWRDLQRRVVLGHVPGECEPLPVSLPQPKPAVVAAALHLPAAPAGAHCQQQ